MLWLNKAFMCCLANTLSVISSASNNKNKSLFTEQLGWGRVKGEKRPASKMFSSVVDGIQSPVLQTCGRATYQFSLIFFHIFFTPKTVKTEQHRIALSFCKLIKPLFLTSEIPIFFLSTPPLFSVFHIRCGVFVFVYVGGQGHENKSLSLFLSQVMCLFS